MKIRFSLSKKKIILILILVLLFTALIAFCRTEKDGKIKLTWDPSITPNVLGYKIYYGKASKAYDKSIKVGNVNTYTLKGLTPGQTYYISATAYDKYGRESSFSNEVSGVAHNFLSATWNSVSLKWEALRPSSERLVKKALRVPLRIIKRCAQIID